MLFARHHSGVLVEAKHAHRGQNHRCPIEHCACPVTLREGTQRVDHFAHREARPACPLYVAEGQGGLWNGIDASAARQLVLLDNQVVLLGRDTTYRLRVRVDPPEIARGLTPYCELLDFRATANERMLFLAHRLGSRVWSKEAVHVGDRYIAVSRPHDCVPGPWKKLVLAEHGEGWSARTFVLPAKPDPQLLGWLHHTGVHFRPARSRSTVNAKRAFSDGIVHFARLGTAPLSIVDVDISGRDLRVDVKPSAIDVTCTHHEPVHVTLASALVTPFVHRTRHEHSSDGGTTVTLKLRSHRSEHVPGSVEAAYNICVRFLAP